MSSLYKLLLTLTLLAVAGIISAQPLDREHLNVGAQGRFSHVLDGQKIYELLLNSTDYDVWGASVGFSTRPEDGGWYERAWNYPTFGIGFSYARMGSLDFKNDSRLGDVANLFGWAEFDLFRTRNFRFGPLLELGLAFTGKTYDYFHNRYNVYIGSKVFAMIGTGLRAEWLFSPQWSLHAGAYLTHHSNGMLRSPNVGINEFAFGAGVRHYFAPTRFATRPTVAPEKPDYARGLHVNVYTAAGVHSCPVELDGILASTDPSRIPPARYRGVAGAELLWRYTPVFASGIGLDAEYAANAYRDTDLLLKGREDPRGYSPWRAGIYLMQEFRYRQLSAHLIFGAYLFKRSGLSEDVGSTFLKIGTRYHFRRAGGLYAGLDMRAHYFDRSYCLEWSLGYSFL